MTEETSPRVASAAGSFMNATDPVRGELPADVGKLRATPLLPVERLAEILNLGRSAAASALTQASDRDLAKQRIMMVEIPDHMSEADIRAFREVWNRYLKGESSAFVLAPPQSTTREHAERFALVERVVRNGDLLDIEIDDDGNLTLVTSGKVTGWRVEKPEAPTDGQ